MCSTDMRHTCWHPRSVQPSSRGFKYRFGAFLAAAFLSEKIAQVMIVVALAEINLSCYGQWIADILE